jgi:hypothetical protein
VCGIRRGQSQVEKSTWTIERARRAGYTRNKKYETDPQAMLLARAQSDVCRRVAPDALMGLDYSVEEREDEQQAVTTVTRETSPASSTTRQRKSTAAPAPKEPPLSAPDAPTAEQDPPPAAEIVELITKAQLSKLHAMLTEAGFTDRDLALAFYTETVEREIASSKDLSKDEASRVIDRLAALMQPDQSDEPTEPTSDGQAVEEPTLDEAGS